MQITTYIAAAENSSSQDKKKIHQRTDLDLQMAQAYFEPFKSTPPLHWKTFKCSWSVGGELRESCSYQCSVQDKMLR